MNEQGSPVFYDRRRHHCGGRIGTLCAATTGEYGYDAAPLLQKRVVVSNKREKVLNDRRARQQTVAPAGSDMRYDVSFRPESGGLEVSFRLEAAQYHALSVGDRGTLSYKGSRFVAFTPEP